MLCRLAPLLLCCTLAGCVLFTSPDVGCTSNADCDGSGLTCDTASGRCVAGTGSSSGSSGTTGSCTSPGSRTLSVSSGPSNGLQLANFGGVGLPKSNGVILVGGIETPDQKTVSSSVVLGGIDLDGGTSIFISNGTGLQQARELPELIPGANELYVIGGVLPDGGMADDERIQFVDNTAQVESIAPLLNKRRYGAQVVATSNSIYVLGGGAVGDGGVLSDYEVAPLLNDGGVGPFQLLGALSDTLSRPVGRVGASAFARVVNGAAQIVVVGGADSTSGAGPLPILGFDIRTTDHGLGAARLLGTLTNPHVDGAAYYDSDLSALYVVGGSNGFTAAFLGAGSADMEVFSAQSDGTFAKVADFPNFLPDRRVGFMLDPICRDLYLIGGEAYDGLVTVTMDESIDAIHLP